MANILFKAESFEVIGACMNVHSQLGFGFKEIIYKDALELEFAKRQIPFSREKPFLIYYREQILPRQFNVDFFLYDNIILEVKAAESIHPEFSIQIKNYLKAAGVRLGILANFGEPSFRFKRVIL